MMMSRYKCKAETALRCFDDVITRPEDHNVGINGDLCKARNDIQSGLIY